MPFAEDDFLPISALQHYVFCPRQFALIHIEQQWAENVFTAEGRIMHERAHESGTERRGDVSSVSGLMLRSLTYGLVGQADIVQLDRTEIVQTSIALPGKPGRWMPTIVEYKRGSPKIDRSDEVQLCAQALCLEEMWRVEIARSSFFYGEPRRRLEVELDSALRDETVKAIWAARSLYEARETPKAFYAKKCRSCSLLNICQPKLTSEKRSALDYVASFLHSSEGDP